MKAIYIDDESLIAAIKKNDEKAFSELYHRYKDILVAFALKKIDEEYVEDIIHDLFAKIWSNRSSLNIEGKFKSYIYSALRNRIFNQIIKIKNGQKYLDSLKEFAASHNFDPHNQTLREDKFYEEIEHFLQDFNQTDRTIVKMRMEGYKNNEIADHLNIAEKTVRNHYSAILKVLRKKIPYIIFFYFF